MTEPETSIWEASELLASKLNDNYVFEQKVKFIVQEKRYATISRLTQLKVQYDTLTLFVDKREKY